MTTGKKLRQVVLPCIKYTTVIDVVTGAALSVTPQPIVTKAMFPIGKVWSGANNADWRKLIQAGKDATNLYDVTFYHGLSQLAYATAIYKQPNGSRYNVISYKYASVPDLTGVTGIDLDLRKSVTNDAMGKLYEKFIGEVQSINGYAFIGELRETLKQLRHPAESLAKLIGTYNQKVVRAKHLHNMKLRQLRKPRINTGRAQAAYERKRSQLERQAKTVFSNLWLEFNFGVKPLAGDIAAAAGAYFDYSNKYQRPIFKVVTARAVQEAWPTKQFFYEAPYGVYTSITTEFVRTTKVKLVATIDMDAFYSGQSEAEILASKFDLGLAAVVPALWDLAPLTVFLDYFGNINTVLSAACATIPKVNSLHRRVTETITAKTSTELSGYIYPHSVIEAAKPGYSEVTKQHYLREKWAMAIPSLSFTTPLGSPIKIGNLTAFLNNVLHS